MSGDQNLVLVIVFFKLWKYFFMKVHVLNWEWFYKQEMQKATEDVFSDG